MSSFEHGDLGTRLDDPSLSASEVDAIVDLIRAELATAENGERMCDLVDLLGKAALRADSAIAPLIDFLDDHRGYAELDYDRAWNSLASHARVALSDVGERVIPVLISKLSERPPRLPVIDFLADHRHIAKPAVPALEQLISDAQVGSAAGYALGRILETDSSLPIRVERMLQDESARAAGMAASASLPRAVLFAFADRFIEMLADRNVVLRQGAASRLSLLAESGYPLDHAGAALTRCLGDVDLSVSRAAASALCHISLDDEPTAAAILAQLSVRPAEPARRYDALLALANRTSRVLLPMVPTLLALFADQNEELHDEVARVLGALGPRAPGEVVNALAARLAASDLEPRSRRLVIDALSSIDRTRTWPTSKP